jgi:lipoate-protein ligase A
MQSEIASPANCRLIVDESRGGALNMAIDETLADTAGPVLRFYAWRPATLSLGYFQAYNDRRTHAASLGCPVVRRSSGGGAIVHDREITYSLVVPVAHPWARRATELYDSVHAALCEALESLGVDAVPNPQGSILAASAEPFLCFERRARGDVLVGNHKVAGSAQRRSRGSVLAHGSVLLEASPAAPHLPGLNDLARRTIDPDELRERWLTTLAERLCFHWQPQALASSEFAAARRLATEKFASDGWTHRR